MRTIRKVFKSFSKPPELLWRSRRRRQHNITGLYSDASLVEVRVSSAHDGRIPSSVRVGNSVQSVLRYEECYAMECI